MTTLFMKFVLAFALLGLGGERRNIEEREIKAVVEHFVASHFEDGGEQYYVEYRNIPVNLKDIPANATLQVAAEPGLTMRGNVLLPVEVFANDRVEHTFMVAVKVRTFGQVLIATDRVEKNENGEALAATEETVETTTLPSDVIARFDALKGRRAKRIINQGAILTDNMFERTPIVNQGSPVTLIVKTNSVVVKAKAIARQDGAQGDIVLVQKAGSSNKLRARVVDEHTVELLAQN